MKPDDERKHETDRLMELYQYGLAFTHSLFNSSSLPPRLVKRCRNFYMQAYSAAQAATLALLAINRFRPGTVLSWLPKDVCRYLARMVFASRVNCHYWGCALEKVPRRSARLRSKRQKLDE